jgi:hypothetical protein
MSQAKAMTGVQTVGLKAPNLLIFMIATILTVCVLVVKLFYAEIPWIKGHEFWALLIAHALLLVGCMSRG